MSSLPNRPARIIFPYMPVRNVVVGKILRIKRRGDGIVKGIVKDSYQYRMHEGDASRGESMNTKIPQGFHEKNVDFARKLLAAYISPTIWAFCESNHIPKAGSGLLSAVAEKQLGYGTARSEPPAVRSKPQMKTVLIMFLRN